jgi:outer membrane protein OmpA-like peptidoglycan-associated protein
VRRAAPAAAPVASRPAEERDHAQRPTPLAGLGNLTLQRALREPAALPPAVLSAGALLQVGNRAVERLLSRRAGESGRPLEPAWRVRLQAAFGVDLGDVRVHTDDVPDAAQAMALTRGRDIHLGRAAAPAGTAAGRALLAHEVAHVVQQGRTTGGRPGAAGSPADRFEQAAEGAAGTVLAGRTVPPMPAGIPPAVQYQRGGAEPDLLRRLLAEAASRGVAYDLDKGVVVGGVPLREVPRGAEFLGKLARGDVQGAIELFSPRDPGERERIRQETLALQRELERLRPAEARERERQEERAQVVAEAQRRLGLPEAAEPGLRLPEPTLSLRDLGMRFGTITPWVLDRFPVGSSALQPQHRAALDDLARQASAHPNSQLEIVGHADTTGPDAGNQRLSQRRAEAVRAYLLGRRLEAGRITSVRGQGEEAPLVEERSAEDRARNRRVEIRFWTGVQEGRPGLLRPLGAAGAGGTPRARGQRAAARAPSPGPTAGPVSLSTGGLDDAELDREIGRLRERLASMSTEPDSPDRIRLGQLEAERHRRDRAAEASAQRAPLGGILSHLARLKAAASKESGAADFEKALDAFRADFAARLAAVPHDAPLPPDLHLVMSALALWSTDPGNQWGEGSWDSNDLVMSAAEYATVPEGQNKCNAYVAEVVNRSLGLVFKTYPAAAQPGRFFPFRARDWGDPKTVIPHFPVVASPVMGDIVSTGSHVGVFLGSYGGHNLYVSARDDPIGVFGTGVQHAHGIQIKFLPTVPVARRYTP